MQIDSEALKRHYAQLSDEALLDIDAADLTDTARQCYRDEMEQRQLAPAPGPAAAGDTSGVETSSAASEEDAIVGRFQQPGELEEARDVLKHAGIPHSIRSSQYNYELVVRPSARESADQALRKQYFDPKAEFDYQNHFELLDDEGLLALETDSLSEAARRLLDEELALRGLQRIDPGIEAAQAPTPGLQLVGTFFSAAEADLARGLLEAQNIPCSLEQEYADPEDNAGGLRLLVPDSFYEQACDVLEAGLG